MFQFKNAVKPFIVFAAIPYGQQVPDRLIRIGVWEPGNLLWLTIRVDLVERHQNIMPPPEVGWLSMLAIFRRSSILCNLICSLATRLKRSLVATSCLIR